MTQVEERVGLRDVALHPRTGSGDYGTRNDAGTVWTPSSILVLVSRLTRAQTAGAPTTDEPLAAVGALVAERLG